MHFLNAMAKHRAVTLLEHAFIHVNTMSRVDAEDIRVVRRMMDLAEAEAVANDGLPERLTIGHDMRRIK